MLQACLILTSLIALALTGDNVELVSSTSVTLDSVTTSFFSVTVTVPSASSPTDTNIPPKPEILCPQNDTAVYHNPYGRSYKVHCDTIPVGVNFSATYTHGFFDCSSLCAVSERCTNFIWIPGVQTANCHQFTDVTGYTTQLDIWTGLLVGQDIIATVTLPGSTPQSSSTALATPSTNAEVLQCFDSGIRADRVFMTSSLDAFCDKAARNGMLRNGSLTEGEFFGMSIWYTQFNLVKVWVSAHKGCLVDFNQVDCHRILRRPVDECNTNGVNGKQGGYVIDNCAKWLIDPQDTYGGSMINHCWPMDLPNCTNYHNGDWCTADGQGCEDKNVIEGK